MKPFSLRGFRHALHRHRGVVLALAAMNGFYGVGGAEIVFAHEAAVEEAAQEHAATLAALGLAAEPAPVGVVRLNERGRRLVAAAGGAVERAEEWVGSAWGTRAAVGEASASVGVGSRLLASAGSVQSGAAQDAAARAAAGGRRAAPGPAPARFITVDEEVDGPATGRERSRGFGASFAASSGAPAAAFAPGGVRSSVDAAASPLPLRLVERRAARVDGGSLLSTPQASSAVATPAPPRRLTGRATPAPEIVALAESLGRSPGRIFRFVHDEIVFEPQWGADAPPVGTLWSGRGSSWEQAWLLQELLIAAGVDARLEWGEVEITPAMLQELTGVEDLFRAGDLLTTAGVAVVLVVQGGQVVAARLPHAWVKAHLDYVPNRGATPGPGDTWLRMDPSLERFAVAPGRRLDAEVPFVLGDYLASGTEASPRAAYEAALLAWVADQGGGEGLADLVPAREVVEEAFPFVPGTLRVKVLSVAGEAEAVPAAVQAQLAVSVQAQDGTPLLAWSGAAPEVWGRRLELAWPGATASDQSTLDLYGGVFATPPGEVDLAPSLRLDGVEVAAGGAIGSAEDAELRLTVTPAGGVATHALWELFAGEHGVLTVAFGGVPQQVVDRFAQEQAAATVAAEAEAWALARAAALYLGTLASDLEHLAALRWHRLLVLGAAVFAVQRGGVSVAADGTPLTFSQGPLSLDVGAMPLGLFPAQGPEVSRVATLELLGSQGSVREGEALAAVFGGEHVTAVTFLTRAVREGQALTLVDAANLEAALAAVELSAEAEATVRGGVDRGLVAWIAERQIEIGGWQTTGYVLEDPATGAGAYLVSFERVVPVEQTAVEIHAPQDLAEVTAPTDVVATIHSDGLESWTLATRPAGEGQARVIASGTGPVENLVLGTFDPTLLLNGLHDVVLTGTTATGQTVTGRISLVVGGGMKIGHFSLSFVDLDVPVSGLPIQIVRTYDSRDTREGDFGAGWSLDIRQGSYRNNRRPGDGWQFVEGFLPCQGTSETRTHLTTIRLSDREVYRFRPVLSRLGMQGGGCFATAGFAFADGPVPGARLDVVGNTSVFWANGSNHVIDTDTFEIYEPRAVRLTTRDGRVFDLDLHAGVTRLADPNGNALTITDAGISHSSGESIDFTRDAEGRIVAVTDPAGESLLYVYDGAGDLIAVTDAGGATTRFTYLAGHYLTDIEDARGVTPIRNEYDAAGRLVRHVDAFGKEIAYQHDLAANQELVTDRLGHTRLLAYDGRGNVIREVDPTGAETLRTFDADDNLLSETDPLGHTTTYAYDAGNKLTRVTDPLGNTTAYTYDTGGRVLTVTDPRGGVTTNEYDTAGNLTRTTDATGHDTAYAYDPRGNLLTETDAAGGVTTYAYDTSGNLTRQTDPLGHVTTHAYDRSGNRTASTITRTLADGTSETLTTTFAYDADGRMIATVQPDGTSTRTEYDALGQVAATVDALGRRTTFTYDALGRQTGTTYPDGTTESRAYDAEGRLTSSTDRGGRATAYVYDAAGRLTETTTADGATVESAYDAAGRLIASTDARGNVTTFTYDAAGRRTRVVDPLGGTTDFAYDEAGNQSAVTDAERHTTSFVYDELGRLVRTVFPDGSERTVDYDPLGRLTAETDPAGRTTAFAYDALGRLTSVTDALSQVTAYGYDELGNRTSQTDAAGHTTRFAYDALGRQVARTLPGGATETMAYDDAGNLRQRTSFSGAVVTYAYDIVNRLTERSYPDGATVSFTYTASGRRETATDDRGTTSYAYDARDRLVAMTTPDGRQLTYAYDLAGNRAALTAELAGQTLTTTYAHDAANRLATVTDPAGRPYAHGYDANGNRASLTHPNGVATTYTYDAQNRLRQLTTGAGGGATVASYAYSLGPAGNRTAIEEADGTSRSYTYDALYRLTGETVADGTGGQVYAKSFTYDPVGNRLDQTHTDATGTPTTTPYTYDERDRLLSEAAQPWTWDIDGNLAAKTGEVTNTWDFDDRLKSVTLADGTVVAHTYDADGVRVRTATTKPGEPAVVVDYLVDTSGPLSHVVAETTADAGTGVALLTAYYVRGDDLLAVMRPAPGAGWTTRLYHADGLGSIRALTDEAGTVTDRYTFTAFGELLDHTGDDPNAYLFAGEMLDPSTGFYYNRARWMDPGVGRFASVDPFNGAAVNPLSLHRYLYAAGDPVNAVDPTGLFSVNSSLAAVGVIGILVVGVIGAILGYQAPGSSSQLPDVTKAEVLVHSVQIRGSNKTPAELTGHLATMRGVNLSGVGTVRGVPVSHAGQVLNFRLVGFKALLRPTFRVRVAKFSPSFFSVVTLEGHPLSGWRFWRSFQLPNGDIVVETAAIEHPRGWLDGVGAEHLGGRQDMLRLWQSVLNDATDFACSGSTGGCGMVEDAEYDNYWGRVAPELKTQYLGLVQ